MKKSRHNIPSQFRWTAFTTVVVLVLMFCIFMVTGCSSDDADCLPPYRQELCEIITADTGIATLMRYSDGRECRLFTTVSHLAPDSVYRVSAIILEGEHGVSLYNVHTIFSPMPEMMKATEIKTDPADVLTCWRDCRYINLRLSVKRSVEENHYMGFINDGLRRNSDGTITQIVRLFHNGEGDADHFRQEYTVSCPIYPFANLLRVGIDSICMKVNTTAGLMSYTMLY